MALPVRLLNTDDEEKAQARAERRALAEKIEEVERKIDELRTKAWKTGAELDDTHATLENERKLLRQDLVEMDLTERWPDAGERTKLGHPHVIHLKRVKETPEWAK